MPLLAELAQVSPDAQSRPFWDACRKHELRLQRCSDCGRFRQPPSPGCVHCGSPRSEWPLLSGRGTLYSYTTVHHPAVPAIAGSVPYHVIVVELDDAPGARVISNLLEDEPGALAIGMPVQVVWDEVRDGVVLPRFRRVTDRS